MEGLIDVENPNRVTQKAKKVSQIELDEPRQLSRRERCVNSSDITVQCVPFIPLLVPFVSVQLNIHSQKYFDICK